MWTKLKKGKYAWLYAYESKDLELLQKFIDGNGFVSVSRSRVYMPIKWFLQHGRDVGNYRYIDDELRFPYADHDYYFKYPSGECVYISQPYGDIADTELVVKAWAETFGIKVEVYDGEYSWHYPHNSLLVVASLPGRDVKVFKTTAEKEAA